MLSKWALSNTALAPGGRALGVMATTTLLTLAYALVMYWWMRTILTAPVALSQSTCVQQGREFVTGGHHACDSQMARLNADAEGRARMLSAAPATCVVQGLSSICIKFTAYVRLSCR